MSEATSSGNPGSGFLRGLGILLLLIILLALLASLARGIGSGIPQEVAQTSPTPTMQCPTQTSSGAPVFIVNLSMSKYPQATNHIRIARGKGKPYILTLDRPGATQRRQQALAGWPTKSGYARDEYPPAIALEGGKGADIMYIDPSDNSGAGATVGNTLNGPPRQSDGTKFCIELVP